MFKLTKILLLLVSLSLTLAAVPPERPDGVSPGPNPPPDMDPGLENVSQSKVLLTGVPAYIWHHGSYPTALGMVMGYYDAQGMTDLMPGDASSQTSEINAAIANDSNDPDCGNGNFDHYQDYSCPIDVYPNLYPDKSQTGGAHASNCIADFAKTSWSSEGQPYGET